MDFEIIWKLKKNLNFNSPSGKKIPSNNIGLCDLIVIKNGIKQDEGEAVYKLAKLPHWGIFWEYRISKIIENYLPCLNHFVSVKMLSRSIMHCDSNGYILPQKVLSTQNNKSTMKRIIDASIYDKIEGKTLSTTIANNPSSNFMFGILKQSLSILAMSQYYCNFTHYDMHSSNIILEEEKEDIPVWYFFNISDQFKIFLPSLGFKVKIIDFEFSHIKGLQNKSFDGRMDLVEVGYLPQRFDPEIDSIHLLLNTFFIYQHKWVNKDNKDPDMKKKKFSDRFDNFLKSIQSRPFNLRGHLKRVPDTIKDEFFKYINHNTNLFKFVENWYYRIIGILFHSIHLNENINLPYNDKKEEGFSYTPRSIGFFSDSFLKEENLQEDIWNLKNKIYPLFEKFCIHLYNVTTKGKESLLFVSIYEFIQRQELIFTDKWREEFIHYTKNLATPLFDIYQIFSNNAFPLKNYNLIENWKTFQEEFDQLPPSIVMDPFTTLSLLDKWSSLPEFPSSTSILVRSYSPDYEEEKTWHFSSFDNEFIKEINDSKDSFQRGNLFFDYINKKVIL
jgi:hypothetical protein